METLSVTKINGYCPATITLGTITDKDGDLLFYIKCEIFSDHILDGNHARRRPKSEHYTLYRKNAYETYTQIITYLLNNPDTDTTSYLKKKAEGEI